MRSPFAIFRKNQKTLMVVLVGLSMFAFVLLGMVNNPADMPKSLVIIAVVAVVGGAAWIAGMSSGRSKEYGSWGLVLGALLAVLLTVVGDKPTPAVAMTNGSLSIEQLEDLRNRREIANGFVNEALRITRDPRDLRQLVGRYTFSFMQQTIDEDVVTGELLRREADRLGIHVTDEAVYDYIRRMTDNKMSKTKFEEIRTGLHVSGETLISILADELQARMAAEYLYGMNREDPQRNLRPVPPEEYWELYKRMYVRQRIEAAAIPVESFIDESAEPTPEEVAALFDKYRANSPYQTPEGRPEEGRPGFKQPRRVKVGYLEAVFDDFRSQIAAVTDEDIERYYQEQYVQPAAEAAEARRNQPESGGPQLPDRLELDLPELPSPSEPPPPPSSDRRTQADSPQESPAAETSESSPSADESASESPAEQPSQADESLTEPEAATPSDESDTSPADDTPSDTEQDGAGQFSVADETGADSETGEGGTSSEAATESTADPAPDTTSEDEPATDTPEVKEPTAGESDATEPASDSDTTTTPAQTPPEAASSVDDPPAPQSDVPLLDEALRNQIRDAIETERTNALLREVANDAKNAVEDMIGYATSAPEDDPDYKTPEQAVEAVQQYAAEHNLHYAETPFLSPQELQESEDHPVGAARVVDDPNGRSFALEMAQTSPQDTYRPIVAGNTETQSWFVAWRLDERAPYQPDDPNDERVREQIVKTWRELEARKKAEARAKELTATAAASGQPLTSSLSETTITGKEGDLFVTVTETPEFSWLSSPGAPGPNPFAIDPPTIQDPPGVERVHEDFMRVVFDELKPGEVGVAPNSDRSIYYVVRIVSRTPTPDDAAYAAFRERFLREPVFESHPLFAMQGLDYPSIYQQLAMYQVAQREPRWISGPQGLFTKYGVTFLGRGAQEESAM